MTPEKVCCWSNKKIGLKKISKKPILKIQVRTLQLDIEWSGCLDEEEPGIVQQLQILKYLIEIWPKSQENLWNKY